MNKNEENFKGTRGGVTGLGGRGVERLAGKVARVDQTTVRAEGGGGGGVLICCLL